MSLGGSDRLSWRERLDSEIDYVTRTAKEWQRHAAELDGAGLIDFRTVYFNPQLALDLRLQLRSQRTG